MATQKALFTELADFRNIQSGVDGVTVAPFLFSSAEVLPTGVTVVGTAPTYVDGMRGRAILHNGVTAYTWRNYPFPDSTKHMFSVWIRPTAEDVVNTGNNWRIIATHRGDGWADRGLHVALFNGRLNARAIGSNQTINLTTDGTNGQQTWAFEADKIYHVCVIYDADKTNKFEVYINNVLRIFSTTSVTFGTFTRSLTVGDMLTGLGALQFTFRGWIDEFIYCQGSEVWDNAKLTSYYNGINERKFLDYWTTPGAIQLPKDAEGMYVPWVLSWQSPSIDLGTGFSDYGRVQVTKTKPDPCVITLYTRSSPDGLTWTNWQLLGQDGYIYSPNERFLQIKLDMSTTFLGMTPVVEEIQVLDYEKAKQFLLSAEPLKVYKDLASGLELMGELKNAYDIIIQEEINGEDILTFKLPINDPKRRELGEEPVELVGEIANRQYTVKQAIDNRDQSGKLFTEFTCEALWYELRDYRVRKVEVTKGTAFQALTAILSGSLEPTGWQIGRCEVPDTKLRDLSGDWKTVLEMLREVAATWGGELVFDAKTKELSLYNEYGGDNGVRFYYYKNLKRITRTVDTYELVTRLYPFGKGSLDIKTMNNGVEYLENYTWVDALNLRKRLRIGHWKDDRYTIPENLLEDAQKVLDDISKPRVAYVIEVQDLSALSGHEHESFNLGDTVYTVDKELFGVEVKSRIMRRTYNVREPWKTVVELAQPKKMLSDAVQRAVDGKMDVLQSSDLLDTVDAQQMTVFNHLLNSRADEGINADWIQEGTGFGVDGGGFSGEACFVCTSAGYGNINRLTQRVYGVSHRSSYTVSTAVVTEGDIIRGGTIAEPFVGIKVIIHYKDGTSETKYLAVPDVTHSE